VTYGRAWLAVSVDGPVNSIAALGDLDGDGIEDVVFCSGGYSASHVYALKGNGTSVAGNWPGLNFCESDGAVPVLGDVNGDGWLEVVTSSQIGYTGNLEIFNHNGPTVRNGFPNISISSPARRFRS